MAKDPLDLLMDVDELLHHPVSAENLAAASALLKKNAKQKLLLSYAAKALVLAGKPDEALEKVDAALAYSSQSWPYFWRAAALVMKGASAKEWAPALKTAFKGDRDVAAEALQQPAFECVRESAEFLAAIGRKKGGPTASAPVKKLISLAAESDEPWALWQAATKLGKHADQASVLDAKLHALAAIVEDLDEHGDANLDLYGGKPQTFFREHLKTTKAARKQLPRAKSAFALAIG